MAVSSTRKPVIRKGLQGIWRIEEEEEEEVQAHTKVGIKMQHKKTKIFPSEVEYLGHKVSQDGVQMLEKYVKDVQNWPHPTSCRWKGYVLLSRICRILPWFYSQVLSFDKQYEFDEECREVQVVR